MIDDAFIQVLLNARRRLPQETWQALTERLCHIDPDCTADVLATVFAGIGNRDIAWSLHQACQKHVQVTPLEVAAAMSTADLAIRTDLSHAEIIWSGPESGVFPIRRIDQVLYDLVNTATTRILLVTFAAYRIQRLCQCLVGALKRGVALTLIMEGAEESEGQLKHDATSAFTSVMAEGCNVLYWPAEFRLRNEAGKPAKLHAKCAVVDSCAVIGSANLTDDALNRNLEIGIMIRSGPIPDLVFDQFAALRRDGVLKLISL